MTTSLPSTWHLDPSSRLATTDMGRYVCVLCRRQGWWQGCEEEQEEEEAWVGSSSGRDDALTGAHVSLRWLLQGTPTRCHS